MEEESLVQTVSLFLQEILGRNAAKIFMVFFVYILGYFGSSWLWIAVLVCLWIKVEEDKRKRFNRKLIGRKIALEGDKEVIQTVLKELPSWVYFPDVERAEWINKILKQIWPKVNNYAKDLVLSSIAPALAKTCEHYKLSNFKFERVSLGSVPCRVGGVIVYEQVARDEIVMDLDINYDGDCDFKFSVSSLSGVVRNFQLHGKMRVIIKPLISSIPLAGGLKVFFLEKPRIDFDNTISETFGIKNKILDIVNDTIANMMVYPNMYPIQLSTEIDDLLLKTHHPKGILRVLLISAKNLDAKDINLTSKNSSDPYAVLEVGCETIKSKIINKELNPVWDQYFEFYVLEPNADQLKIRLFDYDKGSDDDPLGFYCTDIEHLIKPNISKYNEALEHSKRGSIQFQVQYFDLTTDINYYKEISKINLFADKLGNLSTAILTVVPCSANNLEAPSSSKNPDPYVIMKVGSQQEETGDAERSINPVWEKGSTFWIKNLENEELHIIIKDRKSKTTLGTLEYKINNLLNKEELQILKQPFSLKNGGPQSEIILSLYLKIFKPYTPQVDVYSDDEDLIRKPSISSNDEVFHEDKEANNNQEVVENKQEELRRRSFSLNAFGQVQITMRYSKSRQVLTIVVHKIDNVAKKYAVDMPDTYVKLYLLPERKLKKKTQIKKSMIYDEQFEYVIAEKELGNKQLEVSAIYDKKLTNVVLGQVVIPLSLDLVNSKTDWYTLV